MSILELHSSQAIKEELENEINSTEIHIRKIIRNGRKSWTIIEGLESVTDIAAMCKTLKKTVCKCGGSVDTDDEKKEKIIQLQGDHVEKVKEYLLKEGLVSEDKIKCHG